MLMDFPTIGGMSPWEVIEGTLARRRPARDQAWLAEQLGVSEQAVSNWKSRGTVPPARYRQVATLLGLTVDQVEGLEPPPWATEQEWPFPQVPLDLVISLDDQQRAYVQSKLREAVDEVLKADHLTLQRLSINHQGGHQVKPRKGQKP